MRILCSDGRGPRNAWVRKQGETLDFMRRVRRGVQSSLNLWYPELSDITEGFSPTIPRFLVAHFANPSPSLPPGGIIPFFLSVLELALSLIDTGFALGFLSGLGMEGHHFQWKG